MFKILKRVSQVFAILALFALPHALWADVVVITNKSTKVDSLSASEVKNIFLQKKKSFPDGSVAVVGDQSSKTRAPKN